MSKKVSLRDELTGGEDDGGEILVFSRVVRTIGEVAIAILEETTDNCSEMW